LNPLIDRLCIVSELEGLDLFDVPVLTEEGEASGQGKECEHREPGMVLIQRELWEATSAIRTAAEMCCIVIHTVIEQEFSSSF